MFLSSLSLSLSKRFKSKREREIKFLTHILIFLQEDVKEDSFERRESKRGYTHLYYFLSALCDRLERL